MFGLFKDGWLGVFGKVWRGGFGLGSGDDDIRVMINSGI
jgi:hypothetical protein